MSSFSKMAIWPAGYFRSISSWLLRERRDVVSRVDVITAEIARIGFIRMFYHAKMQVEDVHLTESRLGFSVTTGSTLERLLQAYMMTGGNPMDISPFAYPDGIEFLSESFDGDPVTMERYPHGGVVAPKTANYDSPVPEGGSAVPLGGGASKTVEAKGETGYGGYPGGYANTDRYYPARLGSRMDRGAFDSDTLVRTIHQVRSWANTTIKERFQDAEWRIIKQCDLREQLLTERDETLVQAFGGVLDGVEIFDDDRFVRGLYVQNLIQDMYQLLYETNADGSVRAFKTNQETAFLDFTFPDVTSEELRDAKGC